MEHSEHLQTLPDGGWIKHDALSVGSSWSSVSNHPITAKQTCEHGSDTWAESLCWSVFDAPACFSVAWKWLGNIYRCMYGFTSDINVLFKGIPHHVDILYNILYACIWLGRDAEDSRYSSEFTADPATMRNTRNRKYIWKQQRQNILPPEETWDAQM